MEGGEAGNPSEHGWQGRKGERGMMSRVFGIGPQDHLKPASKLIYPLSTFGVGWYVIVVGARPTTDEPWIRLAN